ncbi:MAG: hypothetical protein ACE14V_13370 [bacterium]
MRHSLYRIIAPSFQILLYLLVIGVLSNTALAWNIPGDVPVCTATTEQKFPAIATDGNGGAIITWRDFRDTTTQGGNIYAQRVDANGVFQWTLNGVAVCTALQDQDYPTIVSDSSGGAIITWEDHRLTAKGIYAQRINAGSISLWTTNGVAVCTSAYPQYYPQIISDGNGGAIITWFYMDICAQRLDSNGNSLWTPNGVAVCTTGTFPGFPTLTSDGNHGAILTWQDTRKGGKDIYAQRIDSSGFAQWTSNGIAICTTSGSEQYPMIVSDDSGGAIITWYDDRNGNNDIYAQRINANGVPQWTANGVAVCSTANDQNSPMLVSDGSSGTIITWNDDRSDIYAQRINASGVPQWSINGLAICTAANGQHYPGLISDNNGGAIIVWNDGRNGSGTNIYAQRVNANGVSLWTLNGVAISTAGDQALPTPVSDGGSGAIIAWIDRRNYSASNIDIYAQSITANGFVPVELSRFETMEVFKE